jgi:DnaK suppressor protein
LPAKRSARKPDGDAAAGTGSAAAPKHARTKEPAQDHDAKGGKAQEAKAQAQELKAKESKAKGGKAKGDDGAEGGGGPGSAAAGAGSGSVAVSTLGAKTKPGRSTKPAGHGAAQVEDTGRGLFLEHQRELLLAERGNYTRQAEELRAQAELLALEHEPGDVQFDEEGGEGGTVNVDREMDLHLSAQAQAAIEEIDTALAKISEGTYGACESCGNEIPRARLEALPHARLCVSCKSGGLSARRQ